MNTSVYVTLPSFNYSYSIIRTYIHFVLQLCPNLFISQRTDINKPPKQYGYIYDTLEETISRHQLRNSKDGRSRINEPGSLFFFFFSSSFSLGLSLSLSLSLSTQNSSRIFSLSRCAYNIVLSGGSHHNRHVSIHSSAVTRTTHNGNHLLLSPVKLFLQFKLASWIGTNTHRHLHHHPHLVSLFLPLHLVASHHRRLVETHHFFLPPPPLPLLHPIHHHHPPLPLLLILLHLLLSINPISLHTNHQPIGNPRSHDNHHLPEFQPLHLRIQWLAAYHRLPFHNRVVLLILLTLHLPRHPLRISIKEIQTLSTLSLYSPPTFPS